jgi:hypothetical protein
MAKKAIELFHPGERFTHVLDGRFVVQGTPVVIVHSDNCYDQRLVHARLPGDRRESWGMDIMLPTAFQKATVYQLDEAVTGFFNKHKEPLAPCPNCGQMTWNRKVFPSAYRDARCGDCWYSAFDMQMNELRRMAEDEQRTRDVTQYHAGMRWRSTCVIHPQHGDDLVVDLYTVARIDADVARAQLRQKYPDASLIEVLPIYQLPNH